MKKIILLVLSVFLAGAAIADEDYAAIYQSVQPADFKLVKKIDPFQEQDYYDYAWAPYPLFRTSSALKYKDGVIDPGYYLLAARTMHGRDYVFFKENGVVAHVVPVYKKEDVPALFYENHVPKPQMTKWEKFADNTSKKFFKTAKSSQKQPPPDSYIQTVPGDNDYIVIILYYGPSKYYMVFNTSAY